MQNHAASIECYQRLVNLGGNDAPVLPLQSCISPTVSCITLDEAILLRETVGARDTQVLLPRAIVTLLDWAWRNERRFDWKKEL